MRVKGLPPLLPKRRRLDKMPMRLLPRVGERPAGADRGGDLGTRTPGFFIAKDFGFSIVRGRGSAAALREGELGRGSSLGEGATGAPKALAGTKLEALNRSELLFDGTQRPASSEALERLEEKTGSTFSKSSASRSEALRLTGDLAVEMAAPSGKYHFHDGAGIDR